MHKTATVAAAAIAILLLTAAAAYAQAGTPTTGPAAETWAQWGLAGLVVAYTFWRDHEREKRMGAVIERHHEQYSADQAWIRNTLLVTLASNTEAINRCTAVLSRPRDE